ncbi:MAG: GNA1162 family protein [Pseudomonadota bacterium]
MRMVKTPLLVLVLLALAGCAPKAFDYTAFRESAPQSILVLPPINSSLEVGAGQAIMASSLIPLAESGYYVFPPTLVYEMFKENGLLVPAEIHAVSLERIREVFDPDAVLYISISEYGQKYFIIGSAAIVTLDARLVDARSGFEIWNGTATANSQEGQASAGGGLVGLLVQSVVDQVVGHLADQSYQMSKIATGRLLSAGQRNSLIYGPRHERVGQNGP